MKKFDGDGCEMTVEEIERVYRDAAKNALIAAIEECTEQLGKGPGVKNCAVVSVLQQSVTSLSSCVMLNYSDGSIDIDRASDALNELRCRFERSIDLGFSVSTATE